MKEEGEGIGGPARRGRGGGGVGHGLQGGAFQVAACLQGQSSKLKTWLHGNISCTEAQPATEGSTCGELLLCCVPMPNFLKWPASTTERTREC